MGRPVSAPDVWIAATSLYLQAPLLTNNQDDYKHLAALEIYRSDLSGE